MNALAVLTHDAFSTSINSPFIHGTRYTVNSRRHPQGWWSSIITRIDDDDDDSSKGLEVHTELAAVSYLDMGNTRVMFGQQEVELDAFLQRRNIYSNSRIFIGPDGETYKWSIKGHDLELRNDTSHALIARSHPRRPSFRPFTTKSRPAALEVSRNHTLSDNSQMLDAIIVTYTIMQRLLQERLSFRYPS